MTTTPSAPLLSYEPRNGSGLRHDPLASIIGPRPIGWISTVSASGLPNLAPYSFFNLFNYKPPIVAFSSIGFKDTVTNIRDTGEFVFNLATKPLAEKVNATSADALPEVDEFQLAGLSQRKSWLVAPPAVGESPVSMECRALEVKRLVDLVGAALDTWMVLGEVVMIHIDRRLLTGPDGTYDTLAARPILRAGGPADFYEVLADGRFQMFRPK